MPTRAMRIGAVLMLALLTGCHSITVRTDWDPVIDFREMKRFAWLEPPEAEQADPFADNSLLRKRVRLAVVEGLASRGYVDAGEGSDADFLVTYAVVLDERLRVDGTTSSSVGRGHRAGYGVGFSTTNIRAYQESTLIIDFLEPSNEDLIWRGWGSGIVPTRDRGRDRIADGVRQILDKFPPDPKQGP